MTRGKCISLLTLHRVPQTRKSNDPVAGEVGAKTTYHFEASHQTCLCRGLPKEKISEGCAEAPLPLLTPLDARVYLIKSLSLILFLLQIYAHPI